jgi:type IV secretion system protein VirD4
VRVHFLLDEAASYLPLEIVDNTLVIGRGYGISLTFFLQSMGQLKKCFPVDGGQTLISNTAQIYFGVNDWETAEHLSNRIGNTTVTVSSWGRNAGKSVQEGVSTLHSHASYSSGSNEGGQEQAMKLVTPDEIMAWHPRYALTFLPGMRPICTTLLRYYEETALFHRSRFAEMIFAARTLARTVVFLFCAALMAAAATLYVRVTHVELSGQTVRSGQGEPQGRAGADRRGVEPPARRGRP